MARVFKAPKYREVAKDYLEIPFSATIAAATQNTIVVGPIMFPFKVTGVEMIFGADAADNLRYYWKVARNRQGSTTGVPSGRNIFGWMAPHGYFHGTGITKRANTSFKAREDEHYIKCHVNNLNAYAQAVNASLSIEEI